MKKTQTGRFDQHLWTLVADSSGRKDVRIEASIDYEKYHVGLAGSGLISRSPVVRRIAENLRHVSASEICVLIEGETGTGKELVARLIHQLGSRTDRPFVVMDCGSLTPTLFESEAFGHKKGSFTNAFSDKTGLLEEAHTGILFLDEIDSLDPTSQSKLLRFLQDGRVKRVGENQYRQLDVRIIAASNKDLKNEVARGRFRHDLYQRLCQYPVHLPPLRERPEDLEILVRYYLARYSALHKKPISSMDGIAWEALLTYSYPGNVRELQNIINRAVVLSSRRIDRNAFLDPSKARSREDAWAVSRMKIRDFFVNLLEGSRGVYDGIDGSRKKYSRQYFSHEEIGVLAQALAEFVFRQPFGSHSEKEDELGLSILSVPRNDLVLNSGFSQSQLAAYLGVKNTKRHVEILQLLSIVVRVEGRLTNKLEYFVVFSLGLKEALNKSVSWRRLDVEPEHVAAIAEKKPSAGRPDPVEEAAAENKYKVSRLSKLGIAAAVLLFVSIGSYFLGRNVSEHGTLTQNVAQADRPVILINRMNLSGENGESGRELALDLRALLDSRESGSAVGPRFQAHFRMVDRPWETHEEARKACLKTGASLAIWGKTVSDRQNQYLILRHTFSEENIQNLLGKNMDGFNLLVSDRGAAPDQIDYLIANNRPLPVDVSEKSYIISESYPTAMNEVVTDVFELYNLALGISQLEKGQVHDAEIFLEKAYDIRSSRKPGGARVYDAGQIDQKSLVCFYRGSVRLLMRDYHTSALLFRESIELDSVFSDAHSCEGIALFKTGDIDGAISSFRKAIHLERRAEFFNNLGVAYVRKFRGSANLPAFPGSEGWQGDLSSAVFTAIPGESSEPVMVPRILARAFDSFRKAVLLKPNLVEARTNLQNLSGALARFDPVALKSEIAHSDSLVPLDRRVLAEVIWGSERNSDDLTIESPFKTWLPSKQPRKKTPVID